MKLASIPVCFLILIACGSQAIAQTNGPPFRSAGSLSLLELGMNPVAALQSGDSPVRASPTTHFSACRPVCVISRHPGIAAIERGRRSFVGGRVLSGQS